jgi:hypothetical protein
VDDVGAGIAREFGENDGFYMYKPQTFVPSERKARKSLMGKIQRYINYKHLKKCEKIVSTGHSLGGALASLFATVANKEKSTGNTNITVDYLYTYGAIPVAKTPLEDEKSPTKCFKGVRYVATSTQENNGETEKQADFAVWLGTLGGGKYGAGFTSPITGNDYRLKEGLLHHPKVSVQTIDQDTGVLQDIMSCEDGPSHPSGIVNLTGNVDLHKLSPEIHSSYVSAIEAQFGFRRTPDVMSQSPSHIRDRTRWPQPKEPVVDEAEELSVDAEAEAEFIEASVPEANSDESDDYFVWR